jgi:hypothetical protein
MSNRKNIIPDAPDKYKAYLYCWKIWVEKLNCYKFYGGRKHQRFHKVDYLHSSDNEQFKNDLARSKEVIFEILKYGEHEEMAQAEAQLLKTADNGIGAAKSPLWYNETNGGGLYGKGSLSSVDLDTLWNILKGMLNNHEDISIDEEIDGIIKKFVPEEQLKIFIALRQFLQTRDEEYIASHVQDLSYKFDQDSNPNNWQPLLILMDAEIVDNVPVHKKDSEVIWSGSHRTRGNINSKGGIGLNAYYIPHSMWKCLKGVDFITLSNRCNPDPEKPALQTSEESTATWMVKFAKEKALERTSDDGKNKVPDYDHVLIANELKYNSLMSTKKINRAITIAKKRYENILLQLQSDNLIDFSDEGLKTNPKLKAEYDKKIKIYTNPDDNDYEWVYKISADIFKIGKVIEEIRRKKYKKNGLVLPYFKTLGQRNGDVYKKYKKTFEDDLLNLLSSDYKITIKELPLTTSECKAEGYIDS